MEILDYSPCGKFIATAFGSGEIHILNTHSGAK